MIFNFLAVIAGAAVCLIAVNDVFQSVVVPRAVGRRFRPSYLTWRWAWKVWPPLAFLIYGGHDEHREDFLAFFAPVMLIGLLLLWATLLIAGYGLMLWGLRSGLSPTVHSLAESTYYAGTSLTTLGYGDFVGHSGSTRFLSVLAAITGLGLFSITTAYLFSLFGAFQARETFVVMLGARTGVPPSGVDLLAIAGYSQTIDDLKQILAEAQSWAAHVMESHLAYPTLAYFRSSHDYQSWVGTLGVLLDASTLLMTAVDGVHNGQARIFYNLGRHATHDLAKYLGVPQDAPSPGLERDEFDRACDRLVHAGLTLRDRDTAWTQFSELRSTYAPELNALARFFQIPPLQWIGDRSPIRTH